MEQKTDDYPNWNVPGKELAQLIHKWTVKRLWEEDLQRYQELRESLL